jgi:hypothetical protein
MTLIIGLMLILVAAGCIYAIRQAGHYARDNTLVNTPLDQPAGGPSGAPGSNTANW